MTYVERYDRTLLFRVYECEQCEAQVSKLDEECGECGALVPQAEWFMPDRMEEYYD